jgi:hypothetical protein
MDKPIRINVGVDDDGLASHHVEFKDPYREALDARVNEDPDLIKAKEGIDALVASAQAGWAEAAKARKAAAWGWAMACLFLVVSLVFMLALTVSDKL